MTRNSALLRPALVLFVLALPAAAAGTARADSLAAKTCAAALPPDGQTIFAATLPRLQPGTDLREVVTATTRDLARAGRIDRGDARSSAVAAAKCLGMAGH